MATPIAPTGSGKPDWTTEVSRGQTIISPDQLNDNEKLVVFIITFSATPSLCPWVRPSLAVGGTAHLYDVETGAPMPYNTMAGHVLRHLDLFQSFSERLRTQLFAEGQLIFEIPTETLGFRYATPLTGLGTQLVDPSGLLPHVTDVQVTNVGALPCTGSGFCVYKLIDMASPPRPETKRVKCRVCGEETEVPVKETKVSCSSCGAINLVWYLPWGGKG